MEANIAYYCLHKLHKWPHEYLELPRYEKAVVIAAVQMKLKNDKKEAARARRKRG
ncbi:hypothetical protein [Lacrimispora sp.]|uniref:hypothetical protein n=1 Tax=Lacrimispora sp. TaxID=2719234 RepID=UPI00345F8FD6